MNVREWALAVTLGLILWAGLAYAIVRTVSRVLEQEP